MSSSSTSRASTRPSKDKSKTPTPAQNTKNEEPLKKQPTAEQMRMAQMMQSGKGDAEDPELNEKVNQVIELTGRSIDVVVVALHDCDQDPNRAINMLLEGENDQGEWQESTKRKKKHQVPVKSEPPVSGSKPERKERDRDREGSRERERDNSYRSDGPPPRRGRQPPRLARKNRENEENENRMDSRSRERSFERGRGRGRGMMNGPGRGRGRGRRDNNRGSRFDNIDKGPAIGTWTNETAENAEKENTWGDTVVEDWGDEWTGSNPMTAPSLNAGGFSLEESKVFTASSTADPTKVFPGLGDNDAAMFTTPMAVETQVFTASMTSMTNSNSSALNDSTNTLPLKNSITQQDPIGHNGVPQNTLGQRLDLGVLLQKPQQDAEAATREQQSQFISQFTKQATESLKNAIGVRDPPHPRDHHPIQDSAVLQIGSSNPPSTIQQSPISAVQTQHKPNPMVPCAQPQVLGQRSIKPQRTRLPPPSKIPQSAVEMPGHLGGSSMALDVEFGNWDFPNNSDSGFTFGGSTNSTPSPSQYSNTTVSSTATRNSHLQPSSNMGVESADTSPIKQTMSSTSLISTTPTKAPVTSLDSRSQSHQAPQQAAHGGVYHGSAVTNSTVPQQTQQTPTSKDYNQTALSQTTKLSPPEPIPFPASQSDRKTSPQYQQRSQNTGSMNTTKSVTSPGMTFSQSSYSNSYQSSSYQTPKVATTTSYNSSNMTGTANSSHLQNSPSQYTSHQYQSASFQPTQSSYSNQTNQSTLYQTSSHSQQNSYQSPSSYQNQSNSYQPQTNYQSQSSGYHSRDSQSSATASYQPSVSSQGASSYQSGGSPAVAYQTSAVSQSASSYPTTVSQTSGTSYQRDSQASQSSYGTHQNYATASHQSTLQSSPMSINSNKLTDSLNKMSVKDNSLENTSATQNSYDHTSNATNGTSSLTTTTSTVNSSSLSTSTPSVSSAALGLSTASVQPTATSIPASSISSNKSTSLPITTKAPPNLPPGVPPLIGPNYMIPGQPGMPFFPNLAQQPAMYSYEDLQLLQQRLTLPPTTLTGREQGTLANVPYTGNEGKLGRMEAQSPVQAQTTQQQQQTQSGHQQQAFINPALPPGYYYNYAGGMLPGGYSYPHTIFPVPSVTNAAHGGTTANAQFQKPGAAYGSHAYGQATYDDLTNQGQDFAKAYGTSSQAKTQGSSSAVTSTGTDIAGKYGSAHTQSYDKTGFAAGTPPPFNLPMATGTQAMGAPTAYGTPYMPVMAHQPHSQMLHHHMPQDSTGGSSRGSAQSSTQAKVAGGTKSYANAYWGTS